MSKKKYVILDKITDQYLSACKPDEWIGNDREIILDDFHKSAVFESVELAKAKVELLNEEFKDEEEGIDFAVMEVVAEKVITYHFRRIYE